MIFFFRRLLDLIPVLIGAILISFFLIHIVPGDPVDIMLGDSSSAFDKTALRKELGLDQPLHQQMKTYALKLIRFDLGNSIYNKKSVGAEIRERIPATVELTLFTLLFSLITALPLAILASAYKDQWVDRSLMFLSLFGQSVPSFWLGPLLIWLFSLQLNLLPVSERESFGHLILPVLTLSFSTIAFLFRILRSSMIETLSAEYIKVAQAKGVSRFELYFVHALSNAAFPLLTSLSMIVGSLLSGSVIVEMLFDWPGIGTLVFESIQNRDFPLIQGCILFLALITIFVQVITDCSYQWLNPKVRVQ